MHGGVSGKALSICECFAPTVIMQIPANRTLQAGMPGGIVHWVGYQGIVAGYRSKPVSMLRLSRITSNWSRARPQPKATHESGSSAT